MRRLIARRAGPLTARQTLWPALDAVFFAVGLLLAGPLTISRAGGWYDDFLFVRLARFLLHGKWLGPFDALTLIKGPFYPAFLAACAACGVPVQVATQTVYLCASLLLARVAGHLAASRGAASFCFALLALNPACYDWSATMLMREPLYGALTTLVLALAARVFLCSGGGIWSVLLGVAGAAFWLTREEGVLLVPPVLLMVAWHVHARRSSPVAAVGRPLLAGSICLALVLGVCAVNRHEYGVFRTNDVKGGPFARAYGALVRVNPDHWRRLVPVARETRLRIYAISPAAALLEPFLESDSAHLSLDVDCDALPRPECHDLDGAHFLFALRDAVTRAGQYGSARQADRFYKRLAREIDAACTGRTLSCSAGRSGLWPQISLRYAGPFASSLYRIAWEMMGLGGPHTAPVLSLMHGADAAAYDDILRATPVAPPNDLVSAPGWQVSGAFSTADAAARLVIVGPPGTAIQSELRSAVSPALSAALHRAPGQGQGQGFSASVRCQPGNCRLELVGAGGTLASWALATLGPAVALNTPSATVFIDSVVPLQPYLADLSRPTVRSWFMQLCDRALPLLTALMSLPVFAWTALLLARDFRERALRPMTVFVLALVVAIVGRVVLLALLDATTVAVQFRYEAPATGALLCLTGLILSRISQAAGWHRLRR